MKLRVEEPFDISTRKLSCQLVSFLAAIFFCHLCQVKAKRKQSMMTLFDLSAIQTAESLTASKSIKVIFYSCKLIFLAELSRVDTDRDGIFNAALRTSENRAIILFQNWIRSFKGLVLLRPIIRLLYRPVATDTDGNSCFSIYQSIG